jgi:hypothetical protein
LTHCDQVTIEQAGEQIVLYRTAKHQLAH